MDRNVCRTVESKLTTEKQHMNKKQQAAVQLHKEWIHINEIQKNTKPNNMLFKNAE